MKARNLGRLELLAWLNEQVETDYPKVELCSDGVAYLQVVDGLHPNFVPISRVNFNCKNKDDNARNLKILDDCLTKLKVNKNIQVLNLSNGKFQFNMEFLQWLFDYAQKVNPNFGQFYNGYERRVEAYKKQLNVTNLAGIQIQMSPHLIPNKSSYRKYEQQQQDLLDENEEEDQYIEQDQIKQQSQHPLLKNINQKQQQYQQQMQQQLQSPLSGATYNSGLQDQSYQQQDLYSMTNDNQSLSIGEINEQRKLQLQDLVQSLESELTQQLFNHKMFLEDIQQIEEERNFYYSKLRQVEEICKKRKKPGPIKNEVMQILTSVPEDFLESN
eukprot:403340986